MIAELASGRSSDDPSHRGDLQGIVQIAGALGIGTSSDDPAVREFIAASLGRAEETLMKDDGAGWMAVERALLKRETLTGDEVRALLDEVAGE